MEEIKCKGAKGSGIACIHIVDMSDIKTMKDGEFKLKRKYGKSKRKVITLDYREPEIIGLA